MVARRPASLSPEAPTERGAAEQGAAWNGLLTPFWLDRGVRILAVGRTAGALVMTPSCNGCEVLVLVADAADARAAGALSVGLTDVTVVQARLPDWLRRPEAGRGPYDLVVHVRDAGSSREDVSNVRGVVAAAADLLGPSGCLALAVPNPWGLRSILTGPGHPGGLGPAGLRALLEEHGFAESRWLLPFPNHADPQVIVDASLFDEPGGADLIKTLVRKPVALAEGEAPVTDPLAAFRSAVDAGMAADIADAFLVAATRHPGGASVTRDGSLWMVPPAARAASWASPRQLLGIGDRWLLHAVGSYQAVTSGPFVLEPVTIGAPVGTSAEELLVRVLIDEGLAAPATREVLEAWWAAARAAVSSSPPERRQIDLRPAHFVVEPEGTWNFIPQDITCRFPVPLEVLAFGAVLRTLAETVLPAGWIPGLAPSMTLADATTELLRLVGLDCRDEHRYLWLELEADLLVRTGRPGVERDACRKGLTSLRDTTLGSRLHRLPTWRLAAAGLEAPALAAEVQGLRGELSEARAELVEARAELVEARARIEERQAREDALDG